MDHGFDGPLAVGAFGGEAVRLAIEAMATRFELVYWGPRPAGEDALDEIARLDACLSATEASSDVSWINGHAGMRAVKVEPRTFSLISRCMELSDETDGAFDVTIGPLLDLWKTAANGDSLPSDDALAAARARVGPGLLHLDPHTSTIRFARPNMHLDLGAAGKGYAIDAAIAILRAQGVQAALLRGGASRVRAIGHPPEGAWRIVWRAGGAEKTFVLRDSALSLSAQRARTAISDGRLDGHVIDPRTGVPANGVSSAVVTGPCSLECDVLASALRILGREWLPTLRRRFPGYAGEVEGTGCCGARSGAERRQQP